MAGHSLAPFMCCYYMLYDQGSRKVSVLGAQQQPLAKGYEASYSFVVYDHQSFDRLVMAVFPYYLSWIYLSLSCFMTRSA